MIRRALATLLLLFPACGGPIPVDIVDEYDDGTSQPYWESGQAAYELIFLNGQSLPAIFEGGSYDPEGSAKPIPSAAPPSTIIAPVSVLSGTLHTYFPDKFEIDNYSFVSNVSGETDMPNVSGEMWLYFNAGTTPEPYLEWFDFSASPEITDGGAPVENSNWSGSVDIGLFVGTVPGTVGKLRLNGHVAVLDIQSDDETAPRNSLIFKNVETIAKSNP